MTEFWGTCFNLVPEASASLLIPWSHLCLHHPSPFTPSGQSDLFPVLPPLWACFNLTPLHLLLPPNSPLLNSTLRFSPLWFLCIIDVATQMPPPQRGLAWPPHVQQHPLHPESPHPVSRSSQNHLLSGMTLLIYLTMCLLLISSTRMWVSWG